MTMLADTMIYVATMLIFAWIVRDMFKKRRRVKWDWDRNTLGNDQDKVISSFAAVEATRPRADRVPLQTHKPDARQSA